MLVRFAEKVRALKEKFARGGSAAPAQDQYSTPPNKTTQVKDFYEVDIKYCESNT